MDKSLGFEHRHGIAKAGGGTREVYTELAELGQTGPAVADAHGGMGFGPVEAMVVREKLGRGLVDAPCAEAASMTPAPLAGGAQDPQAKWLPRIASGAARWCRPGTSVQPATACAT